MKSKFIFQVFPSQDRKINLSVCFFGEVTAQQFCFEIYWPLDNPKSLCGGLTYNDFGSGPGPGGLSQTAGR